MHHCCGCCVVVVVVVVVWCSWTIGAGTPISWGGLVVVVVVVSWLTVTGGGLDPQAATETRTNAAPAQLIKYLGMALSPIEVAAGTSFPFKPSK
jgi:hypothetical protein